ncbi:MAG TPA: hypothetical protein VFC46_02445, partial [Humisphaera sp.]|nr:hypothetical protein [Humisphaera sp.]
MLDRSLNRWLPTYVRDTHRRRPCPRSTPIHVLLCVCDHYEPQCGQATAEQSAARVEAWITQYPKLFSRFHDSDGLPPQHTFFFPLDEYDAAHVDALATLCRDGFGEIEIHLHHENDTTDSLQKKLRAGAQLLHDRHGLLPRDKHTGDLKYGFVHGNWALCNSRPDGRWCGVNNELDVLRETGCYCDFTLPSAPSPTQTRKINSVYYAVDRPGHPKSHDRGTNVGESPAPANSLMLIQGPLLLDWQNRKWGLLPRIENGNLQATQPPSMRRLDLWLKARIQVPARPDWFFVKLYTHGATEKNQTVMLGDAMAKFHADLAAR